MKHWNERRLRFAVGILLVMLTIISPVSMANDSHYQRKQRHDISIDCGGRRAGMFMRDQLSWLVGGVRNTEKQGEGYIEIGDADPENLRMYHTNRYGKANFTGKWGYTIPVDIPGVYHCSLYFAEINDVEIGERVFSIEAKAENGQQWFNNIDVMGVASANNAMIIAAYPLLAKRNLTFLIQKSPRSRNGGILSGLSCKLLEGDSTSPGGVKRRVRSTHDDSKARDGPLVMTATFHINCGGGPVGIYVKDSENRRILGSVTQSDLEGIPSISGAVGEEEQEVLRSSVSGLNNSDILYQIPVGVSGFWECDLYFVELDPKMNVGDRIFDVQVQNQKLEKFDILANAHTNFTNFSLNFRNLPVGHDLVIRLKAVQDGGDPLVSAISCKLRNSFPMHEMMYALYESAVKGLRRKPKFRNTPHPSHVFATPSSIASSIQLPGVSSNTSASNQPLSSAAPSPITNPENLISELDVDEPLEETPGYVMYLAQLLLRVPHETDIGNVLKSAIKFVVAIFAETDPSRVSLTKFELYKASARVATIIPNTSFQVQIQYQARHSVKNKSKATLTKACRAEQCSKTLRDFGFIESTLTLLGNVTLHSKLPKGSTKSSDGRSNRKRNKIIIWSVAGGALYLVLVIAFLRFFVMKRRYSKGQAAINLSRTPVLEQQEEEIIDSDGHATSSVVWITTTTLSTMSNEPIHRRSFGQVLRDLFLR